MHLTNLFFHAANTGLLFTLLRGLTGAHWSSAFVAGLFALHPLHVESVAWVAERKDVLSTFFFLLTLLAYVRYVNGRKDESPKSKVQSRGTQAKESVVQSSRFKVQSSKFFYSLSLLFLALGLTSK